MAKLRCFAVKDEKVGIFNTPFFSSHIAEAQRSWAEVANDKSSTISRYPGDFTLYDLGEMDTDKGLLLPHSVPIKVQSALEVIRTPQDSLPFRNAQ